MKQSRVLVVSHGHPQYSRGGGEIAAFQLFKELDGRPGMRAAFLAAAVRRGQDAPRARSFNVLGDGNEVIWDTATLPFHLANANLKRASAQFRAILEGFKPDLVNFHHYFRIGVEAISEVKRYSANVPVVVTLHEYLAICNRDGQMLKSDGRLCERSSASDCATCCPGHSAGEFIARKRFLRHYFDQVDHFVSPSRFLIERYVDWGIPREKFTFVENGQAPASGRHEANPEHRAEERGARVRFAFFGQFTAYKGVDILLEALALMPESIRNTVTVEIHGVDLAVQSQSVVERLRKLIEPVTDQVLLGGPYEPHQVGALMARNDWVVVPSIWWENSPLVIQEAFKHRRPVICADIGGMAEKVRHLENGLHFRAQSARDLARVMAMAATKPELWTRLAANVPNPPTLRESADEYLRVFARLQPALSRFPKAPSSIEIVRSESTPSGSVAYLPITKHRDGVQSLLAGDFDDYVRANGDDPEALWFFLHIPKTAGSSFWHEIARAKKPSFNIAIDHQPHLTGEESRAHALSSFIDDLRRAPVRAARGHFPYNSLGALGHAASGLRLITMLRDPVERVISDYRYSRTPAHPEHRDVIRQYPTIEHYIHARETQNKMVAFLRSHPNETILDLAARISREFAFIGMTEHYGISRLVLFRLLDVEPGPPEHRRRTEALPENEIAVTTELRAVIENLNALDVELYEYFASRWSLQRRTIEEWLGASVGVA